jgi:P-type Ca2+ transporter type 2C
MNLVTDNLPALTLGFTSGSEYIMKLKARRTSEILNRNKKLLIISVGLFMALLCFGVYYISLNVLKLPLIIAQTMTLLTLIMFEISNAFNFRSLHTPFYKTKFTRNIFLIYASIVSLLMTVLIIYTPLNRIFETQPLP